jgi:hypothetical protein
MQPLSVSAPSQKQQDRRTGLASGGDRSDALMARPAHSLQQLARLHRRLVPRVCGIVPSPLFLRPAAHQPEPALCTFGEYM